MFLALAIALATAGSPSHVEAAPVPSATTAIRANGQISDEVWRTATPVDAFVEREPEEGGTPSERTEFRVAFDATTLFVKVWAYDRQPDRIVSYLTRRDGDSPSDWIRVLIDSYHDRRTAYEFAVNPAGVKQDRYWFNDTNRDDGWDAIWDVKVTRDRTGWSAEFHIPFSQLRFTPGAQTAFGFAVSRQIGRLNETSTWPLLPRSASGYVSSFGDLDGLSMSASPKRLELLPYMVTDLTRQRTGGNPLLKSSAPGAAFGLDMKYALTPGLTLTTTVNPDFGQVEADPAVVNLTAFETFFQERRPFFVEGSGTFRFDSDCMDGPCQLFYSRRVGRAPQGTGNLSSGDDIYTDAPAQTTILGAAKLTGRVGQYSIGVMNAFTQQESGTVRDGLRTYGQQVEPPTNYSVARLRRELPNQSSYGLMFTATNRSFVSTEPYLPSNAYSGGADWDIRFRSKYSITGFLVGSGIEGNTATISDVEQNSRHYFQRPDSSSLRLDNATSLTGAGGRVGVNKIAGPRVRFSWQAGFKSPGFDLNDIGFLRRGDERWESGFFQLRSETPNRWFRARYLNFNQYSTWNYDGDRLFSGGNVNTSLTFVNNWSVGGGIGANTLGFDDRFTRGGPGAYEEGYTNFWSWVNSDNRRRLSLNIFNGAGSNRVGSWFRDHELEATYRPISPLTVTSGVQVHRSVKQDQWVENVTDTQTHYTFAHIDQTTVVLTERINYTVTPNLSLQVYAQPFVSAGDYSGFKELVDGRSRDYSGRFAPYAYEGDPDFNVKSFRTTNVLRWEYKPGSTLFIVWQQARENDVTPGGFVFGRDVRDIFGAAPKNVFLVKLAYWLNY